MKKNTIIISIITPTLNNEKSIKKFIKSIRMQNFPKEKLEIIISDGGSTDKTIEYAKKFGARIIKNPYILADPGVNLGIKNANGKLLMVLACDNIYKDKNAFKKIVKVFKSNKIVAAFPIHYSSNNDSIYTKYINTFTDPFNHFVYGYCANGRTFNKVYTTLDSNKLYDLYDYSSNTDKPLIAFAQGFIIRNGFTRKSNSEFDDVLPVIELINKKNKIAFVHSVKLYHHTVKNLRHFAKKQVWATINALQKKKYGIAHRMEHLSDSQKFRVKIWPIYSLSFIFPVLNSVFHLAKDREVLWIFHPFLCMISAVSSIWGAFIYLVNKNYEFKR